MCPTLETLQQNQRTAILATEIITLLINSQDLQFSLDVITELGILDLLQDSLRSNVEQIDAICCIEN